MKNTYETPTVEKLEFDYADVVAKSAGGNGDRGMGHGTKKNNGKGKGKGNGNGNAWGCSGQQGHYGANNGHGCGHDNGPNP